MPSLSSIRAYMAASPMTSRRSAGTLPRATKRATRRHAMPSAPERAPTGRGARAAERRPEDHVVEHPDDQRVQGRQLEQLGRLVEGRLADQQLVAVIEAGELAGEDHDRQAEQHAGLDGEAVDDARAQQQREQRRDGVGDDQRPAVAAVAPQHLQVDRVRLADRRPPGRGRARVPACLVGRILRSEPRRGITCGVPRGLARLRAQSIPYLVRLADLPHYVPTSELPCSALPLGGTHPHWFSS